MSKHLSVKFSYGFEGQEKDLYYSECFLDYLGTKEENQKVQQFLSDSIRSIHKYINDSKKEEMMIEMPKEVTEGPLEVIPKHEDIINQDYHFQISKTLSHNDSSSIPFYTLKEALNFPGSSKEYKYILFVTLKDPNIKTLPLYEWTIDRWKKLNWKTKDLLGVK